MKKHRPLAAILAMMAISAGCSSNNVVSSTGIMPEAGAEETDGDTNQRTERNEKIVTNAALPKELVQIPEEYLQESGYPGTLVELEYDTYESMTYEEQEQTLHKRAIVYLPYGYSEEKTYNVFYLMHGGWSNETTYLGTPDRPAVFKNVLDNGIADGVNLQHHGIYSDRFQTYMERFLHLCSIRDEGFCLFVFQISD